jgi:outer membrane protein assembly factor BamB
VAGLTRAYEQESCGTAKSTKGLRQPPLARSWQLALASDIDSNATPSTIRLLVPSVDNPTAGLNRLFFLQETPEKTTLVCRDEATARVCWQQTLKFVPTWLDLHRDIVIIAGARNAEGFRLEDGGSLWEWSVPVGILESITGEVATEPNSAASLNSQLSSLPPCQLVDGRLFLLSERRRFLVFDVETGSMLWSRWAPGAQVRPLEPGGRFQPAYHAGERWLIAQTSSGRCCIYDSRTGAKLHERDTAAEPWPQQPLMVDGQRVCLLDDCCRLVVVDSATGQEVWSHALPRPSASMNAPQLARDGSGLVVLIDAWQLERLDLKTGKSLWLTGEPRWASGKLSEPWHPALHQDAAWFVRGNVLYAYRLADGKRLWEQPLSAEEAAWRTVPLAGYVMVFPSHLKRRPRLPWKGVGPILPTGMQNSSWTFPILIFDQTDGQLVQRLNFPLEDAEMTVQLLEQSAIVAGSRNAWRLEPGTRYPMTGGNTQ